MFWSFDREAVRRYEELSEIFSEKDNYSQSRELLKEVRVCHAKNRVTMEILYTVI